MNECRDYQGNTCIGACYCSPVSVQTITNIGRATVSSGNAAISPVGARGFEVYDRGELLALVAQDVMRGACLAEAAGRFTLTPAEIADVRTMID